MDCPYCMEKIADNAIVCRFCSRDLNFLRPFLSRLVATEDSLSAVCKHVETGLEEGVLGSQTLMVPSTLAAVMSVSTAWFFYWLSWQRFTFRVHDYIWLFLSASAPSVGALWLAIAAPKISRVSANVTGLIAGLGGALQNVLLYLREREAYGMRAHPTITHWTMIVGGYALSGVYWFYLVPRFGILLNRRRSGETISTFQAPSYVADEIATRKAWMALLQAAPGLLLPLIVALAKH